MTLQEAILSNKPFKTHNMLDYLYVKNDSGTLFLFFLSNNKRCDFFPVTMLLSKEWELLVVKDNVLPFPKKLGVVK